MDVAQGASLLAAFFASAAFLLIVPPYRPPREERTQDTADAYAAPRPAPVIGEPRDWKR